MRQISNADFNKAIRLLSAFSTTKPSSRKEDEDRRQARLLIKKWNKWITQQPPSDCSH